MGRVRRGKGWRGVRSRGVVVVGVGNESGCSGVWREESVRGRSGKGGLRVV